MSPPDSSLFRKFLTCNAVSLLGTYAFDFAVPIFVYERTRSALMLSLVTFFMNLPYFLMAPLTGYLADHGRKRRILMMADSLQLIFFFLLTVLELRGMSSMPLIFGIVFLSKFLINVSETTMTFQVIPAIVPQSDLAKANGWFLSIQRTMTVAGPLVGGLLLAKNGFAACLFLNWLSFMGTLYFSFSCRDLDHLVAREHALHPPAALRNFTQGFGDSLKYIYGSPLFRSFVALMFMWNLTTFLPGSPTVTYYFKEVHQYSADQLGLISALLGSLALLGYAGAARGEHSQLLKQTLLRSSLGQAVYASLALLAFPFPIGLTLLFGVSRSYGASLTLSTFYLRQAYTPVRQRGSINASLRMLFMIASPISALIQAYLISNWGCLASIGFGVICLWITAFLARKVSILSAMEESQHKNRKSIAA